MRLEVTDDGIRNHRWLQFVRMAIKLDILNARKCVCCFKGFSHSKQQNFPPSDLKSQKSTLLSYVVTIGTRALQLFQTHRLRFKDRKLFTANKPKLIWWSLHIVQKNANDPKITSEVRSRRKSKDRQRETWTIHKSEKHARQKNQEVELRTR